MANATVLLRRLSVVMEDDYDHSEQVHPGELTGTESLTAITSYDVELMSASSC
jgi:hypothetical protein